MGVSYSSGADAEFELVKARSLLYGLWRALCSSCDFYIGDMLVILPEKTSHDLKQEENYY